MIETKVAAPHPAQLLIYEVLGSEQATQAFLGGLHSGAISRRIEQKLRGFPQKDLYEFVGIILTGLSSQNRSLWTDEKREGALRLFSLVPFRHEDAEFYVKQYAASVERLKDLNGEAAELTPDMIKAGRVITKHFPSGDTVHCIDQAIDDLTREPVLEEKPEDPLVRIANEIAMISGPPLSVRDEEIKALRRVGLSNKNIAEQVGLSIHNVKKIVGRLIAAGEIELYYPRGRRRGPRERDEEVKKLRMQGFSNAEIAQRLRISRSTLKISIHRLLKNGEIERRPTRTPQAITLL